MHLQPNLRLTWLGLAVEKKHLDVFRKRWNTHLCWAISQQEKQECLLTFFHSKKQLEIQIQIATKHPHVMP